MKSKEIIDLCKRHTMYTWAATDSVNPIRPNPPVSLLSVSPKASPRSHRTDRTYRGICRVTEVATRGPSRGPRPFSSTPITSMFAMYHGAGTPYHRAPIGEMAKSR